MRDCEYDDPVATASTNLDPSRRGWAINELTTGLQPWGTDVVRDLTSSSDWTIGSSLDCSFHVHDPKGRVSGRHAKLTLGPTGWIVTDLGSTNGTFQDGEARSTFELSPGVELGIASVKLIAVSPKLTALRATLARLLGWGGHAYPDIDRALRAVRELATGSASLAVCGKGDLVPLVHRIHAHAVGENAPLVVCGRKERGIDAYHRAANGTLCLLAGELPSDLPLLCAATRRSEPRVCLVLCTSSMARITHVIAMLNRTESIHIPPIRERTADLDRLITESIADAFGTFGGMLPLLRERDITSLMRRKRSSHAELDEIVQRLVTLRLFGPTEAAVRLGIHRTSLSRWAQKLSFSK